MRIPNLEPGHLPVMEEDCEMVEFSPREISRKMMEVAGRSLAAMQQGGTS